MKEDEIRRLGVYFQRTIGILAGAAFGVFLWAQAPEDISPRRPNSSSAQPAPAPATAGDPHPAASPEIPAGFRRPEPANSSSEPAAAESTFTLAPGTRILLNTINSVSTRQTAVGDRIYLETAFPVVSGNKIVIPQGSWVQGTVTQLKRPGRVKGRGQLYIRFDSLILPNGIPRDFRATIGSMDGRSTETVDREKGKIQAPGNKSGDARTLEDATITGASAGTLACAVAGHIPMGAGIGSLAGAGAGLMTVLFTRGPDATLEKGTTIEMVLDRPLVYSSADLDFSKVPPRAPLADGTGPAAQPAQTRPRLFGVPF